MLSRSYWEDQLYFGKPDYIVVGGGLVGMYTAYYLKKNYPDADILVLERGPFGEGASTKNAGYACFGSVSELIDDIELFGTDKVKETLTMRWQGLQLTRSVLKDENINYEEKGGTEVFLPENSDLKNICLKKLPEINALVRECIGMPGVFEYHEGSPKGTKGFDGYIFNRLEGCLNTSMFNNALYQKCIDNKIRFLFGFDVDKLKHGADPHVIHKKYGAIYAKSIFVTTNGFVNHLIPDLDVKPVRNQVIVTEEIEGLQLNGCYHMDKGYFYFRNIGKRILIGGGRNKLGSKEETFLFDQTDEAFTLLSTILKGHIEGVKDPKMDYHWSGILGIGGNKKPIIAEVSEGVFVGVRMRGMGVAICSLVGKQLAELTKIAN